MSRAPPLRGNLIAPTKARLRTRAASSAVGQEILQMIQKGRARPAAKVASIRTADGR